MTQHRQNDARIITHGLSISPEHESAIYQAVGFARCAHRNQKRRYTDEAYINHPIAVARLVAASDTDVDTITAAVLHDVIEDTDVSAEALEAEFGNRVMALLKGAFPAYESLGKGLKLSASHRSLTQLSSTGNQQTYDIVISARLRAVVLAWLQMFTGISIQVVRNPAPLTLLFRLL